MVARGAGAPTRQGVTPAADPIQPHTNPAPIAASSRPDPCPNGGILAMPSIRLVAAGPTLSNAAARPAITPPQIRPESP